MFELITKLFGRFFGWVPRFIIINPNESGIKLSCGKYVGDRESGLHWYWPIVSDIQAINVTTQEINLANQLLDGVGVSGVIWYTIFNVHDALLNVQDYDVALPDAAMGILATHITEPLPELRKSVKNELNEIAEVWGIKVIDVTITDRSPCIGVKVM